MEPKFSLFVESRGVSLKWFAHSTLEIEKGNSKTCWWTSFGGLYLLTTRAIHAQGFYDCRRVSAIYRIFNKSSSHFNFKFRLQIVQFLYSMDTRLYPTNWLASGEHQYLPPYQTRMHYSELFCLDICRFTIENG